MSVLDEVKGDLGLVLWRSLRNVLLWAETAQARRAELFSGTAVQVRVLDLEAARLDTELLAPLSVVAALLERPAAADALRVVNACRRIAMWAEQRGALSTALEFTQAAAVIADGSAALAYAVGRLARRSGDNDRAESWYMRAAVQARHALDWRSYALAFSGMGNLQMQRGNYPAARRSHQRCLRAAERHAVHEVVGDAWHDLFAVEVECRAGHEVDVLAENALRAYGPGHPKLPRLAIDVAYHWVLQGFFRGALEVAVALEPHMRELSLRSVLHALIARAAGGVGDAEIFEEAAARAEVLLRGGAAKEMTARALLGLAHGAISLGAWERAENWAGRAVEAARAAGEGRVGLEAEAALDSIRHRANVPAVTHLSDAVPAETLASDFVAALAVPALAEPVG